MAIAPFSYFLKRGLVLAVCLLALVPQSAGAQSRVASVFLCTDEYLFRLLPRQRIAALSFLAADRYPVVSTIVDQVEGIPLIPMSAEAVLAVKPDAVVLSEGTSAGVRRVLAAANIPVIDVPWANSLDDIRRITRALATRLGVAAEGENLIGEMDARLDAARALAPRPPVSALLYEPNGYSAAGPITSEVMAIAGVVNAAPALSPTRQGTIAVETVVARAPELLILNGRPGVVDSRARQMLEHPALATLRARTDRRWLSLTPLLCPGPWSASAAEDLARAANEARKE